MRGFVALIGAWWLSWAGAALAGGRVDVITVEDAAGRWRATDRTTQAVVIRAGAESPIEKGLAVADGESIRTTRARVEVALDGGGVLNIGPGTEVTVGPRSVVQLLGDVYYRVRGAFQVGYGTVEAVVEGTRFRVAQVDANTVTVEVDDGKVRVSNAGGEVLVEKGNKVIVPLDGPPQAVVKWPSSERTPTLQGTWPLLRPRLIVGFLGGGGYVDDGGTFGGRTFARVSFAPGVSGQLGVGATNSGAGGGLRLPLAADLGWSPVGTFTLAVRGVTSTEFCACNYGTTTTRAVHLGATGVAKLDVAVGRTLVLVGEAEGGWVGGLNGTGWIGVGFGL